MVALLRAAWANPVNSVAVTPFQLMLVRNEAIRMGLESPERMASNARTASS
jgi:hypothetical protein